MRRLLQPGVLLPLLLSAALLTFVFSISDIPSVLGHIRGIPLSTLAMAFALVMAYLALKGIQFHQFLDQISIPTTWKQSTLAFFIGEMTLPIPAGVYAQNYVLRRIACAGFFESSAATVAILVGEVVVSLIVLAILGIPGWYWLGPAILALLGVATVAVLALETIPQLRELAARALQMGPLKKVGQDILIVAVGLRNLFTPRTAVRAVVYSTLYLFSLVGSFLLVAHGVGVGRLSFDQALTVYLFSIAVVLISPISSHLGIIEAGGVGAMQAWGYTSTEGLTVLLGFRFVSTGSVWLAGAITILLLRGEFRTASQPCDGDEHR